MFSPLESVKFEYCPTDVMIEIFMILSTHFSEIEVSMWAGLCARLVLPERKKKPAKQFPAVRMGMAKGWFERMKSVRIPAMKKVNTSWAGTAYDVPDGTIAHLTRKCRGNVYNCHVVDITCGSFEREILGATPYSGAFGDLADCAAKNVADLETGLVFSSAYRDYADDIPHTRNN
jgi:hypothetical protein